MNAPADSSDARRVRHLRLLYERTDALLVTLKDGVIEDANPRWGAVLGRPPPEVLGRSLPELALPADRVLVEAHVERLARLPPEDEGVVTFVGRFPRADGQAVHVEWRLLLADGVVLGIGHDVTARLEAEAAPRTLALIARSTASLVILGDPTGRIAWVNDAFTRVTGFALADVVGKLPREVLYDDASDPAVVSLLRTHQQAGQPMRASELSIRSRDGSRVWLEVEMKPVHDDAAQLTGYMVLANDITERKVVEHQLQESLATLKGIYDSSDFSFISTDPSGVIKTFNRGAEKMLGYRADEVIDRVTPEVIHDRDEVVARAQALTRELGVPVAPGFEAFVARARVTGVDENEWTYVRKDGSRLTVLLSVTALRRPGDGAVTGYLGVAVDLTERQRHAKAQREYAQRLAKLGAHVPGMVYQYQLFPDGRSCFPWASEGIRDVYRVAADEVREDATPVFRHLHPDDFERVAASIGESARTMQAWKCEYRVKFPDGTVRWLLGHATPERLPDGSTLWHGFITDITEQRGAHDKLERLLGEKEVLLKEVHHRVKNNLQVISSILSLQSRRTPEAGTQQALLASMSRVRSIALLHERLYQSGDLSRVDMSTYLSGLVAEVFRAAGLPGVRRELWVDGLELSMEQAMPCGLIVNELVTNALKHAFDEAGGAVTVQLRRRDGAIRLTVADDGRGLPGGLVPDTGSLGTRLVRSLVDQLRARLAVEPGPGGRGTQFHVDFLEAE